jgi:hypothetical protein
MTIKTWQDKALAATNGSQLGAILACALGRERAPPCFHGKAVVTSDGFVQCSFTDRDGDPHLGAFVGSISDLDRNIEGLAEHLSLSAVEHNELTAAIAGWIEKDWRK